MYLNTGFSGKDLQRAIVKHGIFDERMKEAQMMEDKQQEMMMQQFQKFMTQKD